MDVGQNAARVPSAAYPFGTLAMLYDRLAQDLYAEICRIAIIDPHSHINPHQPAALDYNPGLYKRLAPALNLAVDYQRSP